MDVWHTLEIKQTGYLLAVVYYRWLKGLSISDENGTLPLCAYVEGFGKCGHKFEMISS